MKGKNVYMFEKIKILTIALYPEDLEISKRKVCKILLWRKS